MTGFHLGEVRGGWDPWDARMHADGVAQLVSVQRVVGSVYAREAHVAPACV